MTKRLPAQKNVTLTVIALSNQVRALQKANANLRDSRDMWRGRVDDRTKIRAVQQTVRALRQESYWLRKSRDQWRDRALAAERRVR